ncbi:LysR family transcriptional regulator [Streptomyces sp. SM11]|uniref:helix-turn-helix domain-containing protein n=1 Tax=Streptomyces sp. SM11 TaxID=565557 RepID=UPI000CD5C61C
MRSVRRISDLTSVELLLLAVAEQGGLGTAAQQLGTIESAVLARVRAVEHQIGVGLVERCFSGLRLTPAGSVAAGGRSVPEHAASLATGRESLRARRDNQLCDGEPQYLSTSSPVVLRREQLGVLIAPSVDDFRSAAEKIPVDTPHVGFTESPTGPRRRRRCQGPTRGRHSPVVSVAERRTPVTAQDLARTSPLRPEQGPGTRPGPGRSKRPRGA